jgi:hypothetical protein
VIDEEEFLSGDAQAAQSEPRASEDANWAREAEAKRRAGHSEQARRLAEVGLVDEPHHFAGRAVLALACLDLCDLEGARRALEPVVTRLAALAPEPLDAGPALDDEPFAVQSDPLEDLAENELEHAFAQVEAESVEVWTTNRVAEAALRSVEGGRPEGVVDLAEPASPFATETVATLLERQGDPERARAVRRTIEREAEASGETPEAHQHWIGTLERWLDNLRRASR